MVDATLLNRGLVTAQAITGAGGTYETDVPLSDASTLVVQVQMTGGADGDLGVSFRPFETDQATVVPLALDPVLVKGPTHVSAKVYYWAQFDVTALDKGRIRITNNNASGQTIDRLSWRLN